MKLLHVVVSALIITGMMTGCAGMQKSPSTSTALKGANVVMIFHHDSFFNYTLMQKVSEYAVRKGYKVFSDEEFNADAYKADDYAAVVFLVKNEAKGSMKIVDTFVKDNAKTGNIVVAISHEWDVDGASIKKDYDALTAASKEFEQDDIFKKITSKLDEILK